MIILIGGESHVGKTFLAQNLLEKYKISYMSLDHIKMGLIRGLDDCGFVASDTDEVISEKMWSIIKGIIDTCKENKQNLILEGCYLPPEKVNKIEDNDIISVYIGFSKAYIENSFDKIIGFENVIEKRKYPEERTKEEFISANTILKERCIKNNLKYFEITSDYKKEVEAVYDFIDNKLKGRAF